MNDNKKCNEERPSFPKRAVITAGMPYGNKSLHFGHIGGVFVPADFYARFLRDRIGKDNVIFVSGTDCYGSPIEESYRNLCVKNEFDGSIHQFVERNHINQKNTLDNYNISLNLFGASGLGKTSEIHDKVSEWFIKTLYENGQLEKNKTSQFYDAKAGKFLNGRQVIGRCPVQNCNSEHGYADECSLGHQYMPEHLIDPKSTLTGETPEMRDVVNWYFKLIDFYPLLNEFIENIKDDETTRQLVYNTIKEFLAPPIIYVKNEKLEEYEEIKDTLPEHICRTDPKKTSFALEFKKLQDCDKACALLTENGFRFRTGKTLVPFRLTGNIQWGVKAPVLEDEKDLTVWVWPESLWAPISFTSAYLEQLGKPGEEWKNWWCSKDSKIYQFIGSDNIYFYGVAEPAMFMGLQGNENHTAKPEDGQLQMPVLVANNHILFLDKKASSSGKVRPPMAQELLDIYTAEQLRAHFLSLGLGMRSVSFQPKPLNPNANPNESDPVLKEGNLLTNVFNRLIRSCFYTAQKYYDSHLPACSVDEDVLNDAKKAVLEYERYMHKFEFHQVMYTLDSYVRNANKYWSKNMNASDKENNDELRKQTLCNVFHMVRTAAVLIHPLAPDGTEMLREYFGFGEDFWSWDRISDTLYDFCGDCNEYKLKFLEPKIDFFKKHPSQLEF